MRSPCIVKHLLLTGLLLALLQICHTFSKAKTSCISSFTSMVQTWNRFDVHLGTSGDEWRRVFIRKMRGERSIDRMRIYSSEIEDDLFDSLAEGKCSRSYISFLYALMYQLSRYHCFHGVKFHKCNG